MDWNLCVICQSAKTEPLQCPAQSKRKDVGASYSSFAKNLEEFKKINAVPFNINIEILNQSRVDQFLNDKQAKWHKTCRNSFSNEKLHRAKKRKLESENEVSSNVAPEVNCNPIKARRSSTNLTTSLQPSNQCFFCELYDNPKNLHLASTLEVDEKV